MSIWFLGGAPGSTLYYSPIIGTAYPGWSVVAAADFNQNGTCDLVLQNKALNHLAIWYLNGGWRVGSPLFHGVTPDWDVVGSADFDGNGVHDLVLHNAILRGVSIWFLDHGPNGLVLLDTPVIGYTYPNWRVAGAARLDDDSTPDLVLQNDVTDMVSYWFLNPPGRSVKSSILVRSSAPKWRLKAVN